jgi:hypothetical protein
MKKHGCPKIKRVTHGRQMDEAAKHVEPLLRVDRRNNFRGGPITNIVGVVDKIFQIPGTFILRPLLIQKLRGLRQG